MAIPPGVVMGLSQAAVKGHTTLPFGPALAIGVMITCLGWRTVGPQFQFFFFDPTLILALAGVCCVLMIGGGFLIRAIFRYAKKRIPQLIKEIWRNNRERADFFKSEEERVSNTLVVLLLSGRGSGGVAADLRPSSSGVEAAEKICLDLGSSNGGFTDCLLQNGAVRAYAVDVNVDQLDWKLQQDARVIRIKKNARELAGADLPEKVNLVVADVSFISVTKILPAVLELTEAGSDFLILIKPQFELRREDIGPGGIVSDPELHQRAIESVQNAATDLGLNAIGVKPSQLEGAEGNLEFFLRARKTV